MSATENNVEAVGYAASIASKVLGFFSPSKLVDPVLDFGGYDCTEQGPPWYQYYKAGQAQ